MNAIEPTQARRQVWIGLILALVTLLTYGQLATAEFSYLDDNFNLFENPRMNPPTWQSLRFYWTHEEHGLYVPLTYTAWIVLAIIGRVSPDPLGIALNPWIFHSANIVLHVMAVLAVYALLERLLRDRIAACIGALVFALHPVQVEPVAWVAGLKDVLAGLLGVVALWQYVLGAQGLGPLSRYPGRGLGEGSAGTSDRRPSPQPSPGVPGEGETRRHHLLATVALVLAMLAKPSALVVPMIAGVIDLGWIGRSARDAIKSLWPWLVLSVVCAVVGRWAQPATGVPAAPLWARPLIALDALAFYLYKLVFPVWLGIDYGRKPSYVMQHWWFYLTWIVPVSLGILLLVKRKAPREYLVSGTIFVAALAPVLGLVTFLYQYRSTTVDHYLYLAMLGPALAAGALVRRYQSRAAIVLASFALLMLGTLTILQGRFWQDDLVLFTHALEVNPRSSMSLHNLGHALSIRGQSQRAIPLLEQAVKIDPAYAESYEYLATLLKRTGRPADAIPHRLKAIEIVESRPPELQTQLTGYYNSVALDLLDAGRFEEARELIKKALDRTPDDPTSLDNLRIVEEKLRAAATPPASRPG